MRVLVVDDDADIRELIAYKLVSMGHEVETAPDGRAGLDACRRWAPDVAVVDVNMPYLSGLEVVASLRAAPETFALPVLLLTARAQDADVEAGLAAGATAYVTKPFSPAALAAEVERIGAREPDRIA